MNERVVVDPITRIEGHLRIEAQMDGDVIGQAYSSGTMVRGIEIILQGRDPRDAWAFAQRICGVCTLVHGIASIRAVENAIGARVPENARAARRERQRHARIPAPHSSATSSPPATNEAAASSRPCKTSSQGLDSNVGLCVRTRF